MKVNKDIDKMVKNLNNYPLENKWIKLRSLITKKSLPELTGITRDFYLDLAERIVRAAVSWQDSKGMVIDPYSQKEANSGTARFVGALGQLIKAGRCLDLIDICIKSYEHCLTRLDEVETFPEFWTKELMYAYEGLKDKIEPERLSRWQKIWHSHNPQQCYGCIVHKQTNNFLVFAATGEFFKNLLGLGENIKIVEECLSPLLKDFTEYGMYRDPNDPMAYDLVVKQQLDLIRFYGYKGNCLLWIEEICRRGALTSLLYQSVTGQMPFGGRSNQFHFVEAHFACMCEIEAHFYKEHGDKVMAGVFKRAARKSALATYPWIMKMEPFRHTKQGFHPELMHGIDSGGYYSIYGLLAASLFGTAYHLADESINEEITPVEIGGYVFKLFPAFHKVFATCHNYHVEVDVKADHDKDSTGLGRVHYEGIWPETAISGSISSTIHYDIPGIFQPQKNLALGPGWVDNIGREYRLADFENEIKDISLNIIEESPNVVVFDIVYQGNFGECEKITEKYKLSSNGLHYEIVLNNSISTPFILVPLIKTDGMEKSKIEVKAKGFSLKYRNGIYEVFSSKVKKVTLSKDKPAANRNAIYLTGVLETDEVNITLKKV